MLLVLTILLITSNAFRPTLRARTFSVALKLASKQPIIIDGEEFEEIDESELRDANNPNLQNFSDSLPISSASRLERLSKMDRPMTWPGTRPPLPNLGRLGQRMDATWGRGRFRSEVWDDDVNPKTNWWEVYTQSDEETEAFHSGYDFSKPEEYFKSKGIDYKTALELYEKDLSEALAQHTKDKNEPYDPKKFEQVEKDYKEMLSKFKADQKSVDKEKLIALELVYFKLQRKQFEYNFRIEDNKKQALKGQPSLDTEDTGVRFKNDPVVKK